MSTLTITRGAPGSGKDTWAADVQAERPGEVVVVNRDATRKRLFGSDGPEFYNVDKDNLYRKEKLVTQACHTEITEALKAGFDVICSDTNLPVRRCRELRALAKRAGADFEVNDSFASVPLGVCLARNANRKDKEPVPAHVIESMYSRYVKGGLAPVPAAEDDDMGFVGDYGVKPVVKDDSLPPAYIFDIDGTLAVHGDRSPYDYSRVSEDTPFEDVVEIFTTLEQSELAWDGGEYHDMPTLLIFSGRSDECYQETLEWLNANGIFPHVLAMRDAHDKRQDWKVKYDLFDKHARGQYNVRGVFDDRDQVVKLWREMGLTCFQVNYGDF